MSQGRIPLDKVEQVDPPSYWCKNRELGDGLVYRDS